MADPERVGVIFVHGVGDQLQSATLREFAQPVIDWLRDWHEGQGRAGHDVRWSRLSYGTSGSTAAKFAVRIPESPATTTDPPRTAPATHPAQTWIFAEAWWAARLSPPSLWTMVWWTIRTETGMFSRLIVGALQRMIAPPANQPLQARWVRPIAAISTLTLALAYAVALVLAFPLLLIIGALGQIPIETVQKFILLRLLQPLLVMRIGDFYIYVYDEIQGLHVRDAVYDTMRELVLADGCTRLVLVAHSQGAVVAYDALTADLTGHPDEIRIRSHLGLVTTLVTLGGALNNAWAAIEDVGDRRRRDLFRGCASIRRWVDVWANHDPVPGGRLDTPDGTSLACVKDLQVWNALSALRDHGGYFENPEQFLARLAQEIDSPSGRQTSRFFPGTAGETARGQRRELRLALLATWRTLAILALAVVIVMRYGADGPQNVEEDGREVWTVVTRVPIVGELLGLPVAAADASKETSRSVAQAAAFTVASADENATAASGPIEQLIDYVVAVASALVGLAALILRWLIQAGEWLLLRGLAVGILFVSFFAMYAATTAVFFTTWHAREGRESSRPDFAPGATWPQIVRLVFVAVLILVEASLLTRLPSFESIRIGIEQALVTLR